MFWDPAKSAGTFATFAALLAGFALTGLFFLGREWLGEHDSRRVGVFGIWASILPLVTATLLYAEIEGERSCSYALYEFATASFCLSLGAVALFVSLSDVLVSHEETNAQWFGRMVGGAVFLYATILMWAGNSSVRSAYDADWDGGFEARTQLALTIVSVIAAVLLAALVARGSRPVKWAHRAFPIGIVVLTTSAIFVFYVPSFSGSGIAAWMRSFVAWGRIVGWLAVAVLLGIHVGAVSRLSKIRTTQDLAEEASVAVSD